MTIIQKHGSRDVLKSNPGLLQEFQLGYAQAEGDYAGELYIKEGNDVHPITDQVKNEILAQVHDIEGNILSKIRNGKLFIVDTYAHLVEKITADNQKPEKDRQYDLNDQFIVKEDESNNKDTVLWIVFDKEAGKEYNLDKLIEVGENLIAQPVTALDFTYHDPKSAEGINFSDFDTEDDYIAASKSTFGIAVGEPDEEGNTIEIGLSEKTSKFLRDLNGLGLVGGEAGNDLFSKGFVNNVELVKEDNDSDLIAGTVGDVSKPKSAIQLKISGKNKDASNEWQNYTDTITIDLNDLVIDEGSWS